MSYISNINVYQLPTDNLTNENKELNRLLSKNKSGRTNASGMYYKHDKSAEDNNHKPLSDPYELCLHGEDWYDKTATYKSTNNFSGNQNTTIFACSTYGPVSAISDITVTKTGTCPHKQQLLKAFHFPATYEKLKKSEKTETNQFGQNKEYALCIHYDVLNDKRVTDLQFVKGYCPSGYIADPITLNGFTMCKSLGNKPSYEVLNALQKQMDESEALERQEQEEDNFQKLSLVDKIKTNEKYKYGVIGGAAALCCICCLCCIVLIKKR